MTDIDTRHFTPGQIAIAAAKRLSAGIDGVQMDAAWTAAIAERGIELAEDAAFTITTEGGQTFRVVVAEVSE